jgi:photosystem II stability/assembly factor-like uncharacterized protein
MRDFVCYLDGPHPTMRKDKAMDEGSYVFVGAAQAGHHTRGGLFRQDMANPGWQQLKAGLPEELAVQAIAIHPTNPHLVYVGARSGLYRSKDQGDSWERLPLSDDSVEVWSVTIHPSNPQVLYAGTAPVGVHRSDDGGDSWRRLATPALPERVKMAFPCRVMRLAVDPSNPEELYATLEVGGVMRSLDGGESWEECCDDLIELANRPHLKSRIQSDTDIEGMLDGHALCVSGSRPWAVFLAVRMGLFLSSDRGKTWADMEVGRFSPLTYARDVRVSPQDASVLYVCLSPAAQSKDGSLYVSRDLGETWTRFDHDIQAEATMMAVALHPRDADQVHCVSRNGQVFSTLDAGKTWAEHRLPEGVRDVFAVACA